MQSLPDLKTCVITSFYRCFAFVQGSPKPAEHKHTKLPKHEEQAEEQDDYFDEWPNELEKPQDVESNGVSTKQSESDGEEHPEIV